jgi:hypothetical protein
MKRTFRFLSIIFAIIFVMPSIAAPRTVARAATKQSVVNVGTKVSASTATTSSPCQEKYDACMDAGCIIDNDSGGRCQCSNQIKNLNEQLKQIEKDFKSSIDLANSAVDKIKAGDEVNEMFAESGFDEEEDSNDDLDVSTDSIGDKLRVEMHEICAAKIPECKSQLTLIKNMYVQKVKSDCAAFENALKVRGREGRATLAAAEKSARDAALEKYQETNKYDLGQCTIEFTKCMQTTAECGNDFTGCVDTVGKESIYGGVKNTVAINGENSSIIIAQSTMDMLESKKLICESVLKNCVNVQDKVWDAFLKNSGPQIKIAESKAESNIRTSCLDNISDCFVNACKDTIDGNTSYDACLTRPEMVKSFCRVELEPCLAATGGTYDNPESSTLWPSILAKLSAMRVDSCTTEMKECMQSDDRCGSDYSKCIGLDTNIIMRMCPYDKLPGCQKVYGKEKVQGDLVYDEVAQIIEGVILNIDNEMLATCEAAVDTAMTKVCGDSESCAQYALGDKIGAQSLNYQVCQYSTSSPDSTKGFKWFDCRASVNDISDYELGRNKNATSEELGYVAPFAGVITGVIKWESVEITDDGAIDISSYIAALDNEKDIEITDAEKERIKSELNQLQADINRVIASVEQDNFVQYCITGRHVDGVTDMFKNNKVRFPKLSNTIRKNIANAALQQAKENYYREYDKLAERMQIDLAKVNERMATNLKLNGQDAHNTAARAACVNMAAVSAFSKAPVGQALWAKILIGVIVVTAIVLACVFTPPVAGALAGTEWGLGAAAANAGAVLSNVVGTVLGGVATSTAAAVSVAGLTVASVGVTAAVVDGAISAKDKADDTAFIYAQQERQTETHGEFYANEWNYMEKITTDFDNKTGVCKKCVSKRQCEKTSWHLFTNRTCSKWDTDDYVDERCIEIQF